MKLIYFNTFDNYERQSMYVIFLQCTYCVQKSLTVSCTLLCECGDRVKVDQSSFSAYLHAVMLRHHCSEYAKKLHVDDDRTSLIELLIFTQDNIGGTYPPPPLLSGRPTKDYNILLLS